MVVVDVSSGAGALAVPPRLSLGLDGDAGSATQGAGALVVRLGDARREHRLARGRRHRARRGSDERVAVRPGGHERQAGVRAELPRAERQRADVCRRERLRAPVTDAAGQHDDGVDRAHLGVDRDRLAPGCGRGDEREPARARPREPDRLDPRVADEGLTDGRAAAEDEREDTGRQPGGGDSAAHGCPDELARAGVGVVRLDDDRAPGGQGRRRVAARDGEREREVARPEDRDRAEWHLALADVRPGERRALRQGRVDARLEVVAEAYDTGEHPQLARGATELAREAGNGQTRLGDRARHDRLAVGLDLVGDVLQEGSPLRGRGRAIGVERVRGSLSRRLELLLVDVGVDGLEWLARRRLDGRPNRGAFRQWVIRR